MKLCFHSGVWGTWQLSAGLVTTERRLPLNSAGDGVPITAVGNWFQVRRSSRYFEVYHAEAIWGCLFYLHTVTFILIAL